MPRTNLRPLTALEYATLFPWLDQHLNIRPGLEAPERVLMLRQRLLEAGTESGVQPTNGVEGAVSTGSVWDELLSFKFRSEVILPLLAVGILVVVFGFAASLALAGGAR